MQTHQLCLSPESEVVVMFYQPQGDALFCIQNEQTPKDSELDWHASFKMFLTRKPRYYWPVGTSWDDGRAGCQKKVRGSNSEFHSNQERQK